MNNFEPSLEMIFERLQPMRVYMQQKNIILPRREDSNVMFQLTAYLVEIPNNKPDKGWVLEPDEEENSRLTKNEKSITFQNAELYYNTEDDAFKGENHIGEIKAGKYTIIKTAEKKSNVRPGYGNAVFVLSPSQNDTLMLLNNPFINRAYAIYRHYYIEAMLKERIGKKMLVGNKTGLYRNTFKQFMFTPELRFVPYTSRISYLRRHPNVIVDMGEWMNNFFKYQILNGKPAICNSFVTFLEKKLNDEMWKPYQRHVLIDINQWFNDKILNITATRFMVDPLTILFYTIYKYPHLTKKLASVNFIFIDSEERLVLKVTPKDLDSSNYNLLKNRLMRFTKLKHLSEIEQLSSDDDKWLEATKAKFVGEVKTSIINDIKGEIDTYRETVDDDSDDVDYTSLLDEDDLEKEIEAATDKIINEDLSVLSKADQDQAVKEIIKQVKQEVFVNSYLPNKSVADQKLAAERLKQQNAVIKLPSSKDLRSKTIEETSLAGFVNSTNPELAKTKYANFNRDYNSKKLDADIDACVAHLSKTQYPLYIKEKSVESSSDSLNLQRTYTYKLVDDAGKAHTIVLDIPTLINDTYIYINGSKKIIQHQRIYLPIVHVAPNEVQIVGLYNKLILYRKGMNDTISSAIKKYLIANKKHFKVKFGNAANSNNAYQTSVSFDIFAKDIISFEIGDVVFMLSVDALLEDIKKHGFVYHKPKSKTKYPVAYNKTTRAVYEMDSESDYTQLIRDCMGKNQVKKIYESKSSGNLFYTEVDILDKNIPLVFLLLFLEGFTTAMKNAKIEYEIIDKARAKEFNNMEYGLTELADGIIAWKRYPLEHSLIMNGLAKMPGIENISVNDLDNKGIYVGFARYYWRNDSRIEYKIEQFKDYMIDPISAEIIDDLPQYKFEPTLANALIYGSNILASNSHSAKGDLNVMRIRSNEIIPHYVYRAIANGYINYRSSQGAKRTTSIKLDRGIIIKQLMKSKLTEENSILNPILELEKNRSVTYKGESGINKDYSFKEDKRAYTESMLGIMGITTSPDSNAGVVRQLTLEPNITSTRGYVSITDQKKVDELNNVNLMTPAELLTPFMIEHDDPTRSSMSYKQSKFTVPLKEAVPVLVGNKIESVIPYHLSDEFTIVAQQDGKVVNKKNGVIVIQYSDKSYRSINTIPELKRNSSSSFYIEAEMRCDLKVGESFKRGQVIAYNPDAFTKNKDDLSASMNLGVLTKVAILPNWDLYEDSAPVTYNLSQKMKTTMIDDVELVLNKNANIKAIVKIGDYVRAGDSLIIFDDSNVSEDALEISRAASRIYGEDIPEELSHVKKAKHSGEVVDIKFYSTVPLPDLDPSMQPYVDDYWKRISKKTTIYSKYKNDGDDDFFQSGNLINEVPGPVKADNYGRVKGRVVNEGVLIVFFIKYEVALGKGDKVTQTFALKNIISHVIPRGQEPYSESRPDEEIGTFISPLSIMARKVTGILYQMFSYKLLIEFKRQCVDKYKQNKSITEKRTIFMKDLKRFYNTLDKSGSNWKKYESLLSPMPDVVFDDFINGFFNDEKQNFYLEIREFDNSLSLSAIQECSKKFNIPLYERVVIPYLTQHGNPIVTPEPVAVGYILSKRLVQVLSSKNKGSIKNTKRNPITGQVSGEDKNARITDAEMYNLVALDAKAALAEFLGPRADDEVARLEMANQISTHGFTTLKSLTNLPENKTSVRTLDVYFALGGISTNILSPESVLQVEGKK